MPSLMPGTEVETLSLMDNNDRIIGSNSEDSENDPDNHGNNSSTNSDENLAESDVIAENAASSTHPMDNTDVGRNHENSNVSMEGNVRNSGLQSDRIIRYNTDHPDGNSEVHYNDNNRNNRIVSLVDEHNRTNTEALNTDTAVNNTIGNTNAFQRNEQLRTDNDINNEVISDVSGNNNNITNFTNPGESSDTEEDNNDDESELQSRDVPNSSANSKTLKFNCKNCSRQAIALIVLFVLSGLTVMAICLVKFVPLDTEKKDRRSVDRVEVPSYDPSNNEKYGEWTTWGKWSSCTTSCQGGVQLRSRSCVNPPPSGTGRLCPGDAMEITICNNTCPYKMAAFSAGYPIAIKDGKLTFKTLIYQHGEDFDKDTGIFTCSIPGTYTFSVNLVKPQQNATLICHLYKNRSQMMNLVLEPSGGQGYSSVSSTVAAYLNVGDIVYLGGCSEPKDTIHWYSIFTGVLENHFN